MKYSGWGYIDHMLLACEELETCLSGIKTFEDFDSSIVAKRAVVMCLLDLGELITGLGEAEISLYPSESWSRLVGFRNRAAHGYFTMDYEIVYALAINRVPPLYEFLKIQKAKMQD